MGEARHRWALWLLIATGCGLRTSLDEPGINLSVSAGGGSSTGRASGQLGGGNGASAEGTGGGEAVIPNHGFGGATVPGGNTGSGGLAGSGGVTRTRVAGSGGLAGSGGVTRTGGAAGSGGIVGVGGAGTGGSLGSGGSAGGATVSFSNGKASGALNGYGWVALGVEDTVTSPTCDDSSAGGAPNTPITSSSPCMNATTWSNSNALCISGAIPVVIGGDYTDNWGVQIGVNSSDPPATSAGRGTLGMSYSKVTFYLRGTVTPTNTGIRGEIHRAGDPDSTSYCATIRSGTPVMLTAFNTACWDGSGTLLTASDVPNIDKVGVQVSSDTSNNYTVSNFCLAEISFQ
ncbi:MAG TPA: hypothetical protein VF550_04040 [Polyangia bacterium]